MEELKDYYLVLGLSQECSAAQIRKAYKRMALQCHPDKNRGNETYANQQFQEVKEAYAVLRSETERPTYDAKLRQQLERKRKYEAENAQFRAMRDALTQKEKAHEDSRKLKKQKSEAEAKSLQNEALIRQMMRDGLLHAKNEKGPATAAPPPLPLQPPAPSHGTDQRGTGHSAVSVTWNAKRRSVTEEELYSIFEMFGEIDAVLLKKSKALVSFKSFQSATIAVNYNQQQSCPLDSRLTVKLVGEHPSTGPTAPADAASRVSEPFRQREDLSHDATTHDEYEEQTLSRLRNAQTGSIASSGSGSGPALSLRPLVPADAALRSASPPHSRTHPHGHAHRHGEGHGHDGGHPTPSPPLEQRRESAEAAPSGDFSAQANAADGGPAEHSPSEAHTPYTRDTSTDTPPAADPTGAVASDGEEGGAEDDDPEGRGIFRADRADQRRRNANAGLRRKRRGIVPSLETETEADRIAPPADHHHSADD